MDEISKHRFIFHKYPDDLDRLESWAKGLSGTVEPKDQGTYLVKNANAQISGVLVISPLILNDRSYDDINHIIQVLLWTLKKSN